jgi:hypothetical protein
LALLPSHFVLVLMSVALGACIYIGLMCAARDVLDLIGAGGGHLSTSSDEVEVPQVIEGPVGALGILQLGRLHQADNSARRRRGRFAKRRNR